MTFVDLWVICKTR